LPSWPKYIKHASNPALPLAAHQVAKRHHATPCSARHHSSLVTVLASKLTPSAGANKFRRCHKASSGFIDRLYYFYLFINKCLIIINTSGFEAFYYGVQIEKRFPTLKFDQLFL
jgi:hypothetical protein